MSVPNDPFQSVVPAQPDYQPLSPEDEKRVQEFTRRLAAILRRLLDESAAAKAIKGDSSTDADHA